MSAPEVDLPEPLDDEPGVTSDGYFAMIPEFVLYADISAQAVRIYGTLNRRAGKKGEAYPSHQTLADEAHVSVPTVKRAIRELEEIGAIERRDRFNGGRRTSNFYRLFLTPRGVTGDPYVGVTGDPGVGVTGDLRGTRARRNESKRNEIDPADFDEFWTLYPRKVAKGRARKAFASARKKADQAAVLAGLRRALPELRSRPPDKVPYPATWLNDEAWTDEAVTAPAASSGRSSVWDNEYPTVSR